MLDSQVPLYLSKMLLHVYFLFVSNKKKNAPVKIIGNYDAVRDLTNAIEYCEFVFNFMFHFHLHCIFSSFFLSY